MKVPALTSFLFQVSSTAPPVRLSEIAHRNSITQLEVDGMGNISDFKSEPIQSSDSREVEIARSTNDSDPQFLSPDTNPEIRFVSTVYDPNVPLARAGASGQLSYVRSDTDLDKIPSCQGIGNPSKPRSATLDSYNSFKNSRSHFIFFDRLTASFDSMSGTSRKELEGVSREC